MTIAKQMLLILLAMILLSSCASDEQKIAKYMSRARESFEKGEYSAAEILLKNIIQIDPGSVEAHLKLGETYLKSDNPQGAFSEYATVVKLDPKNVEALLKLATFYMIAKKFDESRKHIEAVFASEPNNIDALFLLAGLNELQNNLPKAAETYHRIIALDRKQTRAYIGLAGILVRQKNGSEAESYLQQAKAQDPGDTKTRLALISFYFSQKDNARAEQEMDQAIAANPASADLHIMQGNFYTQQKQYDKAEKAFLRAIELEPKNISAYLSAVRFYDATGNQDRAKAMYAQAVARKPEDSDLKTGAARYFFSNNAQSESEALIEEVLKSRPNYLPALLLKGEILVSDRHWKDAIALFDQILAQDNKAEQAYYFKGVSHLAKGDIEVAKSSLKKAIELNPKDYRAKLVLVDISLKARDYANAEKGSLEVRTVLPDNYQAILMMGKAKLGQGKLDAAKADFNRIVQLQPQNPQGYFQVGIVQRIQKDNGAALVNFEKAMTLNPKLLDVFSQIVGIEVSSGNVPAALARCDRQLQQLKDSPFHQAYILSIKGGLYIAQNLDQEAEGAYQAAILAYPNFTQPYYGLAQLYMRRKETDKAVEQYTAMLQKNPDMIGPNMLLGALFDAQKKYELSEKHYREVLRIDAGFAPAANNLSFLLAQAGQKLDEALMLAQSAKEKLPEDPSVMDTLGWVYYKRGLIDSAIAEFTDSIEILPNNASVHYHVGLAYLKKGNVDLAKEHLRKALQLDANFDGAETARKSLADL